MSVVENPVSLKGSLVNLRTISEDDLGLLYDWREDPESLYLWTSYRHIGAREETERELVEDIRSHWHLYFIIETAVEHKPVGFIYSYEHQLVDGHCTVTTFVDKEYRTRGYGVEAHALFLRYVFAFFNFRKVYGDFYEFNKLSLSVIAKSGYRLEGTFPEHRYFNGAWHTMRRFAFYRDDVSKILTFLSKLEKRNIGEKSRGEGR